jgi:c-di-GMP-binding flagellar brake protein YcgR
MGKTMSTQNNHNLTDWTVSTRRKYVRLRKSFVVRIGSERGTGKDFSLGGIAVESQQGYAVGTTLAVDILLPELVKYLSSPAEGGSDEERGVLRVRCEVVWSMRSPKGKYTTGMRFVNLSQRLLEALSQLIAEKLGAALAE